MGQQTTTAALIVLVVVAFIGLNSIFTVSEREYAVKFRLGEIIRADYEPGLHFKLPFINNVRKFDRRILTFDSPPERYLTSELKNVRVDSFIKWRIIDPAQFFRSMAGDELQASQRLGQVVRDGLRGEFGRRTIQDVVSGERVDIMNIITAQANTVAQDFGIEVVDVRIKRIDLPAEVSVSVYRRMEAERARVAADLRARGAEAAERIRADADRQREVLLAEARRDADVIRGQGDAEATRIYSAAFGQDRNFYNFVRSLEAYRSSFDSKDDILVIEPDSEFFRFFRSQSGQ